MPRTDHDTLAGFVKRAFERLNREQFPTVHRCARGLRWSMARVEASVEGDPECRMDLTSFGGLDEPLRDHFVELVE